jgi:hypothetical protein
MEYRSARVNCTYGSITVQVKLGGAIEQQFEARNKNFGFALDRIIAVTAGSAAELQLVFGVDADRKSEAGTPLEDGANTARTSQSTTVDGSTIAITVQAALTKKFSASITAGVLDAIVSAGVQDAIRLITDPFPKPKRRISIDDVLSGMMGGDPASPGGIADMAPNIPGFMMGHYGVPSDMNQYEGSRTDAPSGTGQYL